MRKIIPLALFFLLLVEASFASNPQLFFNETCYQITKKLTTDLYYVNCTGTLTVNNTASETLYDFDINYTTEGITFLNNTFYHEILPGESKIINYSIISDNINITLDDVNQTGNYSDAVLSQLTNITGVLLVELGLSKMPLNQTTYNINITFSNPNNADMNLTGLELRREAANTSLDPSLMDVLYLNITLPQIIQANSNMTFNYTDSFNETPFYVVNADYTVVLNVSKNMSVLNYTEVNVTQFYFDISAPDTASVGTKLPVQISSTNEGGSSAEAKYTCWILGYYSQTVNNLYKIVAPGESYNPIMTLDTDFLSAGTYKARCELNVTGTDYLLWDEESVVFVGPEMPSIGGGGVGVPFVVLPEVIVTQEVISNKTVSLNDIVEVNVIVFNTENRTRYNLTLQVFITEEFELVDPSWGNFDEDTRILRYEIPKLEARKFIGTIYKIKVMKSWKDIFFLPPAILYENGIEISRSELPLLNFITVEHLLLVHKQITPIREEEYLIKILVENIGSRNLGNLTLIDFSKNASIGEISPIGNVSNGRIFWGIDSINSGERLYFQYKAWGPYEEEVSYPQVLGIDPKNVLLSFSITAIVSGKVEVSSIEPLLVALIVLVIVVLLSTILQRIVPEITEEHAIEREFEKLPSRIRPVVKQETMEVSFDLETVKANIPEIEKQVKELVKEIKKKHKFEPVMINPKTGRAVTIKELKKILKGEPGFRGASWFDHSLESKD